MKEKQGLLEKESSYKPYHLKTYLLRYNDDEEFENALNRFLKTIDGTDVIDIKFQTIEYKSYNIYNTALVIYKSYE